MDGAAAEAKFHCNLGVQQPVEKRGQAPHGRCYSEHFRLTVRSQSPFFTVPVRLPHRTNRLTSYMMSSRGRTYRGILAVVTDRVVTR